MSHSTSVSPSHTQGGQDLQKQEEEAEEETEAAGGAAGETDAGNRSPGAGGRAAGGARCA